MARRRAAVLGLVVAAMAACGGGGSRGETVARKQHVDGPAPGTGTGGAGGGGGGPGDTRPLDAAECATLYDHVTALALGETPAELQEETRSALEANRPDAIDECTRGRVSRPLYTCFMAATKWDQLQACDAGDGGAGAGSEAP